MCFFFFGSFCWKWIFMRRWEIEYWYMGPLLLLFNIQHLYWNCKSITSTFQFISIQRCTAFFFCFLYFRCSSINEIFFFCVCCSSSPVSISRCRILRVVGERESKKKENNIIVLKQNLCSRRNEEWKKKLPLFSIDPLDVKQSIGNRFNKDRKKKCKIYIKISFSVAAEQKKFVEIQLFNLFTWNALCGFFSIENQLETLIRKITAEKRKKRSGFCNCSIVQFDCCYGEQRHLTNYVNL